MLYMLDTDICSYIIKQRPVSVLARLEQVSLEDMCISAVTLAELMYGVERSSSKEKNLRIVTRFVRHLAVLSWDHVAAEHYVQIRTRLERVGTPIGNMDLMIAAHARSQGAVVVTNNIRHFQRVPKLRVENWAGQ